MRPYYEADGITIYHGDCMEVLPRIVSAPSDAIVTDPPYGISYRHGARAGGISLGMDGKTIVGDDVPFDPTHLLSAAPRLVLWGGNHFADRLPSSRGWLVWDKRDDGPEMDQSDAELAWTNVVATVRKWTRRWSGAARGGREQSEGRWHVNQKPVALMDWCLGFVPGGRVIDPYAGSGSTLIAAMERRRPAIGIEIDEAHCESAALRLSQGVLDFGGVA